MYKERTVVKLESFFWAIVVLVFMFQEAIVKFFDPITYMDEALALAFFAYYMMSMFRRRINKTDMFILGVIFCLCALGFAGNGATRLQDDLKHQLRDAFNIFKFVMILLGAYRYFDNYTTKRYLIHYVAVALKLLISVGFVFMLLNFVADIGMHTDIRHGMRTYQFIFIRVGSLYNSCMLWLVILTAEKYCNRPKYNGIFILMTLAIMVSTLRSRALAFVVVYAVVYYLLLINTGKKHWWLYGAITAVALLLIGKNQFEFYFSGDTSARSVLLRYGIVVARSYFPLGAGFATYGTAVARDTNAKLYGIFGFNQYWGLGKSGRSGFLTDNYWPAIMGEFGFIGLGLMAILLGLVILKLLKTTDNDHSRVCILFIMGSLLLASIATSSFLACTPHMMLLALVCKLNYPDQEKTVRKIENGTFNRFYPDL